MKLTNFKGPSEHSIQVEIINYLKLNARPDIYYFSVPNGGLRHPRVAMKLKAEGLRPGVADLVLMLPQGRTAFLELKTATGRLSDYQLGFKQRCFELGHAWGMARSLEEAVPHLESWNVLKRWQQRS